MASATGRKIGPLDLSKVSSGFEALPPGTYRAALTKRTFDVRENGKNAGADTVKLEYTLNAEEHPELKGRKIFDNIDIVEAQFWRLRSLGDALGMSQEQIAAFDVDEGIQPYVDDNAEVEVVLGTREYEGKTYNQVSRYQRVGGNASAPAAASNTAKAAKPF